MEDTHEPVNEKQIDVNAITKTVRDYIESCYEGNPDRIAGAIHPAMIKRALMPHEVTNRSIIRITSASQLIENIRGLKEEGFKTPETDRRFDLTILDIYEDIATVKVFAHYWLDYLHLIKIDNEWKIINVLWRLYDWEE
jgi:hypothetical protein